MFSPNALHCLRRRNRQFEAEQVELQQELAGLQEELAVLNQRYGSLLEQVGQQHGLIRRLSGEDLGHVKREAMQPDGERLHSLLRSLWSKL